MRASSHVRGVCKHRYLPIVYDLRLPDEYFQWMDFFSIFEVDVYEMIYPGLCLQGGFRSRLLLHALGPLILLAVVFVVGVLGSVAMQLKYSTEVRKRPWLHSLLRTLPFLLFIAYCLVAGTSTSIFAAWRCEVFEVDSLAVPITTTKLLREDMTVACDLHKEEYSGIIWLAFSFVAIWPIGVPLAFLVLLISFRRKIQRGRGTRVVRATSFLHREYHRIFYW